MKLNTLPTVALLWTALGAGVAAPERGAPPAPRRLDEIVPADTLLYVSIPDAARARDALATTALADIWREPEVRNFFQGTLTPMVRTLWARTGDGIGREVLSGGTSSDIAEAYCMRNMTELPGLLCGIDGEVSLALFGADKTGPVAVATWGPCRNAPRWEAMLRKLCQLSEPSGKENFEEFQHGNWKGIRATEKTADATESGWARHGDRFVFARGPKGALEAWSDRLEKGGAGATLVQNADYRAAQARCDRSGAAIAHGYLNTARTREKILESLPDPVVRTVAPAMIDGLGFSNARAMGMSLVVKDKGFLRSTVLLAPGEKKGLLTAMAGNPKREFRSLAFIPAGTHSVFAGRIDPKQVWRSVQDAVRAGAGEAGLFSMREKMAEDLPPGVLRDLPAALGGEIGLALKQQIGVMPIPEIVLFVELADEEAARRLVGDLLARGAEEKGFKVQTLPAMGTGPAVTTVTFPDVPILPAFAIHKGWLVAGMTQTAVKAACRRIDSPDPAKGIAATADFKAAFSRVARPASFMAYEEGPDSFRKQYNQIVSALPMVQMALEQAMGDVPFPDPATLPMADTIARHLFGSAQAMGADADGVYLESFGVLPVNLTTDIGVLGVGAALVLPAIARARGRAEEEGIAADDPLAGAFEREGAADDARLSAGEMAVMKGVRATLEAAAVGKKLVLFDADGDGTGEYPSLDGKGWQGFVDAGGNFLLPFCETDGVWKGYRFSMRAGKDPEKTAYVLAVPVDPGKTGSRVFIGATDGALYQAKGSFSWKDGVANYLKEDGGTGRPPGPFVPVGE